MGVLGPTKWVRECVPQHKVHHSIRYADFPKHCMYLIAWYYCSGKYLQNNGWGGSWVDKTGSGKYKQNKRVGRGEGATSAQGAITDY